MLQLVINNQNFLNDNIEMNNLVESVRYGLKHLLNNEENHLNNDLLNNLLQVKRTKEKFIFINNFNFFQSLPKQNPIYAKNIQLIKCKSSSSSSSSMENYTNDTHIRLHDKVGLVNIGNTCYLNAIMQALYACTK